MKTKFIKEVKTIKNEELKSVCMKMVEDAPKYFWTAAASSSGKYHPKCSLGEGGLVRHSIMVKRIATDLLDADIFMENSDTNRDMAIVATLFHDIMKQGKDNAGSSTVFEHPILAARFVSKHLKEASFDPTMTNIICSAINTHMGKWTKVSYSNFVLKAPKTPFEMLVHAADYMASRKYIGGLDDWTIE